MPSIHPERPSLSVLTAEQVAAALRALPDWRLAAPCSGPEGTPVPQALQRSLRFIGFQEAIAFLQTLVEPLEALNHHPRIENMWSEVTLTFTTWDVGHRLTELDIQAAMVVEQRYRTYISRQC